MGPQVNILLVCAGNTCRSPMGEGLLASAPGDPGRRHRVRSAGLRVASGSTVSEKAVRVKEELDVDIAGHVPRPVTADLIAWADAVVPVERWLGERLLERFPAAAARVRYLARDVKDPLDEGTLPAYRRARDELRDELGALMVEGVER